MMCWVVMWVACGVVAYGMTVTEFVSAFPALYVWRVYADEFGILLRTDVDTARARALIDRQWVGLRWMAFAFAMAGPFGVIGVTIFQVADGCLTWPRAWTRRGAEQATW